MPYNAVRVPTLSGFSVRVKVCAALTAAYAAASAEPAGWSLLETTVPCILPVWSAVMPHHRVLLPYCVPSLTAGEGIPDLLQLMVKLTQSMMTDRLTLLNETQATVSAARHPPALHLQLQLPAA